MSVDFILFDATDLAVIEICHLISTDDLENQGQSYLLWPLVHHGLYTWYMPILAVDLNISDVENLKMTNMSPDLYSWPWKSRLNILSNYLYYLWLNTCYRLDFSISFNLIEVEELNKSEIKNVAMRTDLENDATFEKMVRPWKSRSTIKVRWLILGFLRSSTLWMLDSTPRSSQ